MALLDKPLLQVAVTLLRVIGVTGTVVRKVRAFQPGAGAATLTETSYTVKMTPPYNGNRLIINADSTLKTQQTFIVAGKDTSNVVITIDPKTDFIRFGGQLYRVEDVTPYYSGDNVAAYEVKVQK